MDVSPEPSPPTDSPRRTCELSASSLWIGLRALPHHWLGRLRQGLFEVRALRPPHLGDLYEIVEHVMVLRSPAPTLPHHVPTQLVQVLNIISIENIISDIL